MDDWSRRTPWICAPGCPFLSSLASASALDVLRLETISTVPGSPASRRHILVPKCPVPPITKIVLLLGAKNYAIQKMITSIAAAVRRILTLTNYPVVNQLSDHV